MEYPSKRPYILEIRINILLGMIFIFMSSCIFQRNLFAEELGQKPKIILIGIDSAEWPIINKLIKQNRLPNFAMLMKNGSYGSLKSFPPMISPVLWTSIITGKSNEKHGIMDGFFKYFGEYELRPVTSSKRKVKTLWNIFSENEKTVGIINWYLSYPVEKVKGFIASNYFFFLPSINTESLFKSIKKEDIAYPESIIDDAVRICQVSETNKIYVGTLLTQNFLTNVNIFLNLDLYKNSLGRGIRTETELVKVGKYLSQKYSPNLFAIFFWAIDGAQHMFLKYTDYQKFSNNIVMEADVKKYGQVIFNVYEAYDKMIGDLLDDKDKNKVIIIVSPLGLSLRKESNKYNYLLNFIFEKKGWLVYRKDKPDEPDWSKTKIYDYGRYFFWRIVRNFLYINLKGRDPKGIVSEEEYNLFLEEIKNLKKEVKTIEGKEIIADIKILKRNNPSQEKIQSPDLIITLKDNLDFDLNFTLMIKDKIYKMDKKANHPIVTGQHHPSGIIIVSGKNIKKGIKIKDATIFDISPTILALSGLPIADDMEGKVLTDVIEERFLQDNPITYIPSYEKPGEKEARDPADISMDEYREYLNNKLKALGYLN